MSRMLRVAVAMVALAWCWQAGAAQSAAPKGQRVHEWWHEQFPDKALNSPNAKKLPLISVKGNRFVDPQGNTVLFRGVSIGDPDKLEQGGHWNKDLFVHVQATGARIVRIPVHPISWRELSPEKYLQLLDQAVEWCTELGMYIDVDWHSIGNLKEGLFQDPMYVTTVNETFQFWRTISRHFVGNNTIAFYELFNEPTTWSGQLGRESWDEWKRINEDLIITIRANNPQAIPLVAGFDWAYLLTPLRESPIAADGVAYVTHPYPHKRGRPWEPKWEEDFGFAAGSYPVVATEIGYDSLARDAEGAVYGPAIIKYLEGRGISWIAWAYDVEWGPQLLKSWDKFDLSESGEFFTKAMKSNSH